MRNIFLLIAVSFYGLCDLSAQVIGTFAGNGSSGNNGDGGIAINASIDYPVGGIFDKNGNYYFTLGTVGNSIRKISSDGIITTVAGESLAGYSGDGGLAINARLNNPQGICIDTMGNIFIADAFNHRIRKIDVATGVISTIAGTGTSGFSGDGGSCSQANINSPGDIDFDKEGNLYFSDVVNNRIRKIEVSGIINSVAGNGVAGHSGDGGLAINGQLALPHGLYVDDTGNIFIADNICVRYVNHATGIISTIAGGGTGGDGGLATDAQVIATRVAKDKNGNLFISEKSKHRVRVVNSIGIINSVVGDGTPSSTGDGGLATLAKINYPSGLAFDTCGNLYISESHGYRIRKVTFSDTCTQTSVSTTISKKNDFVLYPNPVNEQLTISGENSQTIFITNILGKIVHWKKASAEKTVVSMSALNAGIYFVTVTDKQGVKVTKKVVKE